MELNWVGKIYGFHGVELLQTSRIHLLDLFSLNKIRTSGVVDIMDIDRDMNHMGMPHLPKIPTCTMLVILTETTSSNSHSSDMVCLVIDP